MLNTLNFSHSFIRANHKFMIFAALIISLVTGGVAQKSSAIVFGSFAIAGLESSVIANAENMDGLSVCAACTSAFIVGGALIGAGVYGACFAGASTTKALCCACCQQRCCECCCTPHACSITSKIDGYKQIKDQSHIDYATSSQAEEDLDHALQHIHFLKKEDKSTILDKFIRVLDLWSEKEVDPKKGKIEILKKTDNDDEWALDVKLPKNILEDILAQSRHSYTQEQTKQIFSILSY
ncbi:MAG: hypothetical protein AB8G05_17400 [Oligoflexales bacterium]